MLAGSMALTAALAVTPNFYEPDPQLEKFELMIEKATTQNDAEDESLPSLYWRALGWVEFFLCATVTPSAEYRKSRSDWTPAINNTAANFAAWTGAVGQGVNMASEYMRTRRGALGWAMRASAVAACSTTMVYNFNRGFFHE